MKPLTDLNDEQRHAVTTTRGPVLVLAGAGSGKTRVITHRIAHLLEQGALPGEILAVTFTNKAAAEMRERVKRLLGGAGMDELWISTFHSFGLGLLRRDANALGFSPRSTILDEEDRAQVIRQVMQEHTGHVEADLRDAFHAFLQDVKGGGRPSMEVARDAGPVRGKLLLRVFRDYQARLKMQRSWDFDDLLLLPLRLLKEVPEVRSRWAERFRYIMVDEYQDTNVLQVDLLAQLASRWGNLCVVGDDDQSIYRWRGARVENILEFGDRFPGTTVIKLTRNYRSTREILDLANGLIRHNLKRHDKELWTDRVGRLKVDLVHVPSQEKEAEHIAGDVLRRIGEGAAPKDIAVLYRTRGQARLFEEYFTLYDIPYRVVGSFDFFRRREVRDALAYWKLAVNPFDDTSFLRIVNTPARGVGTRTLERLTELKAVKEGSLWEALEALLETPEGVPARSARELSRFRRVVGAAVEGLADANPETLHAHASILLAESGYRDHLSREKPAGWQAVESLLRMLQRAVEQGKVTSLGGFLEIVALEAREKEKGGDGKDLGGLASLITLHSAKGLEFPHVYIAGLVEGLLPHARSMDRDVDLEEERRLLYVGITRARSHLALSHYGTRKRLRDTIHCIPSRFLEELPPGLLERSTSKAQEKLGEEEFVDALGSLLKSLSD
ncbi:MAG: UvrD-helicase domain-containing protein [Pseudomonadota bacterium]